MKWKEDSLVSDLYRLDFLDFQGVPFVRVSLNAVTGYWSYRLSNSSIAGQGFATAQEAREAAITALIEEARQARTQETQSEEEQ